MSAGVELAALVVSVVMLMGAAVTALTSASVLKRIVAVLVALVAAALAAGVLSISAATLAAIALMFVYGVVGAAILVRLQESYGASDANEIDSADDQSEAGDA